MCRILLTDGQQRKTLAAARSLGRAGHEVFVADETWFSTSRFSRFCHRGLISPPPTRSDAYRQWLLTMYERHRPELLIPMDDHTTALTVTVQDELPFRTLLPTAEQFTVGNDKARTAELARRAGVPCPVTVAVETEAEALRAVAACNGPAVLRLRVASGGRGIFFVNGADQAREVWRQIKPGSGGFLVQERIPQGRKFDVCLLYDPAGDLCAFFVQEELRWFPLERGPSTLQVSVDRPDLVDLARQLLAPLGWRGPVEVEFMEDATGRPVLMEINPRFWASLALAIRCGVDFPGLIARLARGQQVQGPDHYPVGIRCRWLLPGDLLHFLANPNRFQMKPGLLRTYDERTFDDILAWDDPGPTLGFALAVFRYIWDPAMWRLLFRW